LQREKENHFFADQTRISLLRDWWVKNDPQDIFQSPLPLSPSFQKGLGYKFIEVTNIKPKQEQECIDRMNKGNMF